MSASVWNPSAGTHVLSNLARISQEFTAGVGQTTFTLLITPYTVGAQNLEVFKNGEKVLPSDVTEVTGGASFIIAACVGGEELEAVVFPSTSAAFTTLVGEAAASAAAAAVSAQEAEDAASALEQFTGAAIGGDLTFVTGDPNALFRLKAPGLNTFSLPKLAVQNATALQSTNFGILPGAGGTSSSLTAYGTVPLPAVLDANTLQLQANQGVSAKLVAGRTGALQPYVPFVINVGGADVVNVSVAGNTCIGTANPDQYGSKLSIVSTGSTQSTLLVHNPGVGSGHVGFSAASTSLKLYNCYADGTLANGKGLDIDPNGNVLVTNATGGLGYGAGAGGASSQQTTSRTTAMTLNTPSGDLPLFTAAGSATPSSFIVNNNKVAINDVITITTRGGSNKYIAHVTNIVAATSFEITFWAAIGTASDSPTFHYNIGRGSNS